ncbi:MAG TPA: hypothetical protein VHC22_16050 [Pirellulales bacterium]|nr:hypothetical protein [Pirellulales bacterium]
MTIDQASLRDLCRRVAAGDEQARQEFERHVPPLVEVIVRRWLRRQEVGTASAFDPELLAYRAVQLTQELCARMIGEFDVERQTAEAAPDDTMLVQVVADTFCCV